MIQTRLILGEKICVLVLRQPWPNHPAGNNITPRLAYDERAIGRVIRNHIEIIGHSPYALYAVAFFVIVAHDVNFTVFNRYILSIYYNDLILSVLTKECHNIFDATVDMKSGEKGHSQFNHTQRFGNHDWFSFKSGEPMPLSAVISFYRHGAALALE